MLTADSFGDFRGNMIFQFIKQLRKSTPTSSETENNMSHSPLLKKILTYSFIFLSLTFIFGTLALTLVIKSIVVYMRHTGWLVTYENTVIMFICSFILLFIMLFAKWLTIWFTESKNTFAKGNFSFILSIFIIFCIFQLLPNTNTSFTNYIISKDNRFIGGPYPDATKLEELKSQGIKTIISLLDPLALPSEPFLIKEEEETVAALGLNLIKIPLLSGRVNSIEGNKRIETVAKSAKGEKYYVHGYKDQDRVKLFINIANEYPLTSTSSATSTSDTTPSQFSNPALVSNKTVNLERGTAIQIDNHVIVSPKPTTEEFTRYFLTTPNPVVKLAINTVISLSPDENTKETSEITNLLKMHHINYYSMPVQIYPYDTKTVMNVVEKIKSLSGGVLIYSYYMPPQSTAISAFMLSYLTNLPALPASLFTGIPMQGGSVKTIAPNVAIGPRPNETEFKDYLQARGITSIAYAGTCNSNEADTDKRFAKAANMQWVCLQVNNTIVLTALKSKGPWYVYGPVLPLIENELTKRMNKLMPDHAI